MIKVLIVDDHAIVRQGLKRIIEDATDMKLVGEAASAADALALLSDQHCDVAIFDLTLPDKSGLDLLREVKSQWAAIQILILSMHAEEQYAVRALRAGAAGYLNKRSAPEELLQAIRKIYRTGKYISPELADLLAAELKNDTSRLPHELLSDREFQVLCLIASGKSVSEIADHLALSVTTISTYRTRILEKMQLKSNADLTRYALEHKLVN